MLGKLLIANRGEIACRIIRTCKQMGIATVAVYSDADADAHHTHEADEAIRLGPGPATESYLNIEKIIEAARRTNAEAIHPGYGFLAENAAFARAVAAAGIVFIGPSANAIEAMGSKREAKRLLKDVPLVPGYNGDDQGDEAMTTAAADIGYPVMIKASAGGGGKGMRRVDRAEALQDALSAARREAEQAFGDATLIIEQFVQNPRHIEIQIFGDTQGKLIALGERECSIQRRHQKIIEEAPSPFLDADTRQRMSAAAVKIGEQLGYVGAGTVEFLVDADRNFYFMEMNTRLQVEHPVTEAIYGLDLVRLQIQVAEGQPLPEIAPPNGHAIEVRLYAENPATNFLPATGTIALWRAPANVRVDAGIRTGDEITTYYDPMLAKVITHGPTRNEALRKLDDALARTVLFGFKNNLHFLRRLLNHPAFTAGETTTNFIDQHPELLADDASTPAAVYIAAAIAKYQQDRARGHWRNNSYGSIKQAFKHNEATVDVSLLPDKISGRYTVEIEDSEHTVMMKPTADGWQMTLDGHRRNVIIVCAGDVWYIHQQGQAHRLEWQSPLPLPGAAAAAEGSLRAPMPGQIIKINVEAGQQVSKGDILLTLEAMKMEHRIQAPYAGIVTRIHYAVGDSPQAESVLLELSSVEDKID